MEYSIVIPVYNSGDWIGDLTADISRIMDTISSDYEIVLVNDGSPKPDTWAKIKAAASHNPHIYAINMARNVGQIKALIYGLKKSSGDVVITMDDDFQHRPDQIPALLNQLFQTGSDIVIAQYDTKKDNGLRKLGSQLVNNLYFHVYNKPKDITSNSFRAMKRNLVQDITNYQTKRPQFGPLVFGSTKSISTVEVKHDKRKYGKSGYSLDRMIQETKLTILNKPNFLARVMYYIAAVMMLVAFVLFILGLLGLFHLFGLHAGSLFIWMAVSIGTAFFSVLMGLVFDLFNRVLEELTGPSKIFVQEEYKQNNGSRR